MLRRRLNWCSLLPQSLGYCCGCIRLQRCLSLGCICTAMVVCGSYFSATAGIVCLAFNAVPITFSDSVPVEQEENASCPAIIATNIASHLLPSQSPRQAFRAVSTRV